MKRFYYDTTYTTQTGKNLGESSSSVQSEEQWFSRRHPQIKKSLDEFPKFQDSNIGGVDSVPFPSWSVWFPGDSFPEHPDTKPDKSSSD